MYGIIFVMEKISNVIRLVLSSNLFWIGILAVVALQGIWYALSFAPILFDEDRHLDFIFFYTDYLNPFISVQTPAMDYLGQVAREPSYLYYYLMSFPLRAIQLFTADYMIQVIILRVLNIGLFVGAIFILRKIFLEVGISKLLANVSLLLFALIPTVAPMAGVVSYDVGVFFMIALLLLHTVRVYKKGSMTARDLTVFIVLSVVASVIKYTALPVVLAATIVILVRIIQKRKVKIFSDIKNSFLASTWLIKLILIVSIVISAAIFVERPLQNALTHKSLNPSCLSTLPQEQSRERCVKNYVYERNILFLDMKPDNFKPVSPFDYFFNTWIPGMVVSLVRQVPSTPPLSLIHTSFYFLCIVGSLAILLALRELLKKYKSLWVLVTAAVFYIGAVYLSNYSGYVELGQPVAISARYLLPAIPLVIVLVGLSLRILLPKARRAATALAIVLVLLLVGQGGGLVSYILQTNGEYFWPNSPTVRFNEAVKPILSDIVVE